VTTAAFDEPETVKFNVARRDFLASLVTGLDHGSRPIRNALDVGCGYGYFAGALKELGIAVTAVDGRAENIEEAARRNPGISFRVLNAEDLALRSLGKFDLVICLGLLYHLENPFLAVRNLCAVTEGLLVLESVCIPVSTPSAVLYQEDHDIDQGLNYIALIPSESWLVKALYVSGFPHVYRPASLPQHHDFKASVMKRRRRTILIGSWTPLESASLHQLPEPTIRKYLWDRFGPLLESDVLRSRARAIRDLK
jgi:2-polyprenyl-3-methyl-5-hydroxy-6-metoxy-1,4-benzoquinol methylase